MEERGRRELLRGVIEWAKRVPPFLGPPVVKLAKARYRLAWEKQEEKQMEEDCLVGKSLFEAEVKFELSVGQ